MNEPLIPVATALGALLNVAAVTNLAPGGVWNQLPEDPTFPAVRYTVRGRPTGAIADQRRWQLDVEIDVLSAYTGDLEGLQVAEQIFSCVNFVDLNADGWETPVSSVTDLYPVPDEEIDGRPIKRWTTALKIIAVKT